MASLYKKPILVTDPRTGKKVKAKSKKWWGQYRDADRRLRRVPLTVDKLAAQAMLSKIVRDIERAKAGLIDPTDAQRKRPLEHHMAEFKRYLENRAVTTKQVQISTMQIEKIVTAKKWKFIGDISASGALDYLGDLRTNGRSAQTYNHYLKSIKQFTRWLVRDHRTPMDPLVHLSKLNVATDRRHYRRAVSPDEFARLIDAAENGKKVESISGPDRAMMYVLAAWTGFRKGEIGSLTKNSLRLDDDPPTATVDACYSKRRREDAQVLHPDLVARLRVWLDTKKQNLGPSGLLFPISARVPGGYERKTHKMMERDLSVARAKWIKEAKTDKEKEARAKTDFLAYRSHDGRFADFHSNRHLFITNLERAGLSPKMAQTLARHSDIRLTLGVYTHVGISDQTAAIEALPAPPQVAIQDAIPSRSA